MLIATGVMACLLVGTFYSSWTREKYILLKSEAQDRTAMFVRGRFLYVVPEREYVAMRIAPLSRQASDDARDAGRYRWLRDQNNTTGLPGSAGISWPCDGQPSSAAEYDAVIDADMLGGTARREVSAPTDAERLDWLQRQVLHVYTPRDGGGCGVCTVSHGHTGMTPRDLRAAIDAAMARQAAGGTE